LERQLADTARGSAGFLAAEVRPGTAQPVPASVRSLRLPRKLANALEQGGVHTVGELARLSRRKLTAIPGIGGAYAAMAAKAARAPAAAYPA
jgi:DNA-directed RNA polymerase alpha subunit